MVQNFHKGKILSHGVEDRKAAWQQTEGASGHAALESQCEAAF